MIEPIEAAKKATRILIVKSSSLGDVCNALPVADVIHQGRPNSYIGWAVKEPFRALIDVNPNVDTTFAFSRKDLWAAVKVGLETRKVKYEVALDMQSLFVSSLIARLSGARIRIGYDTRKEMSHLFLSHPVIGAATRDRKAVDLMLDFPKAIGIDPSNFRPQRWLGNARRHDADSPYDHCPKTIRRNICWRDDATATVVTPKMGKACGPSDGGRSYTCVRGDEGRPTGCG